MVAAANAVPTQAAHVKDWLYIQWIHGCLALHDVGLCPGTHPEEVETIGCLEVVVSLHFVDGCRSTMRWTGPA